MPDYVLVLHLESHGTSSYTAIAFKAQNTLLAEIKELLICKQLFLNKHTT